MSAEAAKISRAREEKQQLPAGWRRVRLGEFMPKSVRSLDPAKSPNEVYVLYSIPAFDRGAPDIVCGKAVGSTKRIVLSGDVLLSKIVPHIRRTWVVRNNTGKKMIASTEWIIFRTDNADSDYLKFALTDDNFHQAFMNTTSGVGGSLLRACLLLVAQLEIPIPPLPELRRIAAILKEQMAVVEKARTAAQERLTAVKALPAAFLRQVFPKPGQPLPNNWRWIELGKIFKLKSGQFLPASSMAEGGAFPVYGGNGINGWHGTYMFEESKIVIGRVGALCGCVQITRPQSWITENALYVREKLVPFDNHFMSQYLAFLNLNHLANQMGQPVIASGVIYKQLIGLPLIEA